MGKVLYIVIVIKHMRESERVVVSRKSKVIAFVLVLVVRDTVANPVPAHALRLLDFSRK
jgi:hypothetical protein